MRTIGLVGGTSWVSTQEYYRIINSEVNARCGGQTSARLVLYSVNFGEVLERQARKDFDGIAGILADAAHRVAAAGADCVLLCANTLHMHADAVQSAISVPMIHLIDATSREIARQNITKVGLLGTRLTMELDFYARRLSRAGIETVVPEKDAREYVNGTIERELVKSDFRPASREGFLSIIRELGTRGAQGVILGCTEIPLLVPVSESPLPAFDTTRIHALAAVDFALAP